MSLKNIPKGVVALGFVSMFMDLSSEMIHSILPLFLTTTLGVSALTVGIIEGIAESTAAVVKIFSGAISDWLGRRKPLLLAGYGLATLFRPLFAVADSFGMVLLARFSDRIGKGIRGAPRDALLADITPPEVRGSAYGLRQSLDNLGAVIGPLAAMLLMLWSFNDFRLVFWVSMIPACAVMIIIVFFIKEPTRNETHEKRPFPLKRAQLKLLPPRFWLITAAACVFTLARFSDAFLILRADSIGLIPAQSAAILIVMNIVYASSSWPAGLLSDRVGKTGLLSCGIAVLVIANMVLGLGTGPAAIYFGAALWGLHMGMTQGIITAYVADVAPAHLRGTAFGMYNLLTGGALLLASVIAGWLWKDYGPAFTFAAGGCFAVVSLCAFIALRPLLRRKHA